MSDRWGPEGPPDEAYSRVSRDLAAVTAGFSAYLDGLPAQLQAGYECRVRAVTDAEGDRLRRWPGARETYAVDPGDPDAAVLLVARAWHEGGAMVALHFGRAAGELIPGCFCDACDEDSASLIEQASRVVDAAVGGVTEFRRPHVPRPGVVLDRGPWLEEGYRGADGTGGSGAGAEVTGELFEVIWRPWTRLRV